MLADRFAGAESLLLLDNCEHVVDAVADLVARLLDAAPGLTVLATSQVPLGLDGEVVHVLDPLSPADAAALFGSRAASAAPGPSSGRGRRRGASRRSAARWTGCRWRSSWPPRG